MVNLNIQFIASLARKYLLNLGSRYVPVEPGVTVSVGNVHNLSSRRHIASYAFCDWKPANSDNIPAFKSCSNSCYVWPVVRVGILT